MLYLIIGINIFLQLCILGYIYNLELEYKELLKIEREKNDKKTS